MLNESQILEQFSQGFDCSQVVLGACADKIGLDPETAKKVAACFGGGMWYCHECGAVTGALMAIGAKYVHSQPGDQQAKNQALAKMNAFREAFSARQGSCVCREILGYDLSDPEQMAKIQAEELLTTRCPKVVRDALEILEEIL